MTPKAKNFKRKTTYMGLHQNYKLLEEFPGSPEVKTLCFHCHGSRSGNYNPTSHVLWPKKQLITHTHKGFPGGSEVKVSACNVGDLGLIPGSGRSPGEGNDNPLQYSCLENPMDGGAW